MKLGKRHITFLTGSLSVFVAFLFFARHYEIYAIVLLSGLALALLSFLAILFGKENARIKTIWCFVLGALVAIHILIEPLLVKSSYILYVKGNSSALNELNAILATTDGNVHFHRGQEISHHIGLPMEDIERLSVLRKEVGAYLIMKSDNVIYYGLFGFLDTRLGVWYSLNGGVPEEMQDPRHLTQNWYY